MGGGRCGGGGGEAARSRLVKKKMANRPAAERRASIGRGEAPRKCERRPPAGKYEVIRNPRKTGYTEYAEKYHPSPPSLPTAPPIPRQYVAAKHATPFTAGVYFRPFWYRSYFQAVFREGAKIHPLKDRNPARVSMGRRAVGGIFRPFLVLPYLPSPRFFRAGGENTPAQWGVFSWPLGGFSTKRGIFRPTPYFKLSATWCN